MSDQDYFTRYREAQRQANLYNRSMGLEKVLEYGHVVYSLKMIPKRPKDRYGWETRCQVVEPEAAHE